MRTRCDPCLIPMVFGKIRFEEIIARHDHNTVFCPVGFAQIQSYVAKEVWRDCLSLSDISLFTGK